MSRFTLIVFIDNYSHVSWVYLLKDKDHVPNVIKKFFNEIKTKFLASPKLFHTDNVLKFVQNEIAEFYATLSVLHETTCPHTSQQNNVTERKHRHILDITRTLMIQVNVLKYL